MTNTTIEAELVGVSEAARILGLSVQGLLQQCRRGKLPTGIYVRVGPRNRYSFRVNMLERWAEERPRRGHKRHTPRRGIAERNALAEQWINLPCAVLRKLRQHPMLDRWARAIGKEDLLQEGRIALLRAAELWDGGCRANFCTYAHEAIRRRLLRVFNGQKGRLAKSRALPSDDVLPETETPEGLLDLPDALRTLPARYRAILAARYGLDGAPPLGRAEVAEQHGVGKTRVDQIVEAASVRVAIYLLRGH